MILLLIGALPTRPYSSGWGYYPSGGLGLVLIVIIVLLLLGRMKLCNTATPFVLVRRK
jgi:Protein of unknown function (DUF3309)